MSLSLLKTADELEGGATSVWLLRSPCCLRRRIAVTAPSDLQRDPLFLANALNLVFMLLYTLLDFFRAWDASNPTVVSAGLVILGWGYVLDALLYVQSYGREWPAGAALVGEATNVVGSLLYAVTSVLYFWETDSATDSDVIYCMEATSTGIFLVCGTCYFVAWYEQPAAKRAGRGCDLRDLDLWANLFNVAASIVYVVAAANGLMLHFSSRDALIESVAPPPLPPHAGNSTMAEAAVTAASTLGAAVLGEWKPGRPAEILRSMAKVYVYGDILWTIDAGLYIAAWVRDYVTIESVALTDEAFADEDQRDGDAAGATGKGERLLTAGET